jgi:NADPH-dependent glutamate synthase beta subunit-like oxidoreductase/2,4-dienoyl-CoA reductase-like NADH-dependent reductase (Old Yellow Enzyme family)
MWEFTLTSIAELHKLAESLSVYVPADEDISVLTRPVKIGSLTAANAMAVNPMEGADGDGRGRPCELTFRRYERFAAGGAGILWAEAIAVVRQGRANPRQLWLNDKSKDTFARMIDKARKAAALSMGSNHRPIIVAQLTHSGRYSKPEGTAYPIIPQRDPYRDALTQQQPPFRNIHTAIPNDWPLVTDEYLDSLIDDYVKAAKLAFEAGFDAVDIKSCHGYLLNEILACYHRLGKYGGSFENRTRLLLSIIDAIHSQLGSDKIVVTRLGIYDAIPYPYGWAVDKDSYTKPDLAEPKKLFALLAARNVPMINVTIANPYYNPHYGRPFNEPIIGGYQSPEHPLAGVARMVALTAEMQKEFPQIALVGTGYSWLRTMLPYVGAAVKRQGMAAIIGAGRMAFAYPDFAKDIIATGRLDPNKVCVACSACTQIMRDGGTTGCVVRDNKIYGPIYRQGRMSSRENLARLAANCRRCQESTCQVACPAGVNIPQFIELFLDGKDREAYEAIRLSNIFPEICAWLCPVENQCEGNCIQKFIGDGPLPIADIQRYLAEQANTNGWSKLRIPVTASGKKIAIVGAGPAGLACTACLLESGHTVTVFDKAASFGGMVDSVIQPDRLSQSLANELNAVFKDVPEDRLILNSGKGLDEKFNLDSVIAMGFDAIFIGLGLTEPIISSRSRLDGFWDALTFLATAKTRQALSLEGKRIAVIGGGNTAMDSACTAKRLGAKDVYILYRRSFEEMPAWSSERDRALKCGVHFLILTQRLDYIAAGNKLTGIKVCPTQLGEPDASGRRKPVSQLDSAYTLYMDIVIEAIGQQSPSNLGKLLGAVELDHGLVKVKSDFQTSRSPVFAGGDIIRGASTVVAAVADGMKAAQSIHKFLSV